MKKVFLYILFIFIIMVILTILIFIDSNKIEDNDNDVIKEKYKLLNNINEKVNYFKYENLDRYVIYKNKNPYLKDIDIITRVNIGLDKDYYTDTKESKLLNSEKILVNKYISLPSNYVPDNLEVIDNNKMLVNYAKDAFIKMVNDASNEGYTIRAISAYRSYDYQKKLYDNYVKKDGIEKADTYSARPGYSEHQTGLVVDIDNGSLNYENFEKTKEFIWMQNNCFRYGFILRYPKNKEEITGYSYESWHYRYVGINIATYIHENNITFDEYYIRFIDK